MKFIPIKDGFTLDFDNKMKIEAFYVKHAFGSLGYKVMEKRSRLKAGIDPKDARDLAAKGQIINEDYWANVFTWTLDSASYDKSNIANSAWLVNTCRSKSTQ